MCEQPETQDQTRSAYILTQRELSNDVKHSSLLHVHSSKRARYRRRTIRCLESVDSPAEFPFGRHFNNDGIALSESGAAFVLGVLGVNLLSKFSELARIDDASLPLEHDATKIVPSLGVFIEDNRYVGIRFNIADFLRLALGAEVDLVSFEHRTDWNVMRNAIRTHCGNPRNTHAFYKRLFFRRQFHAA